MVRKTLTTYTRRILRGGLEPLVQQIADLGFGKACCAMRAPHEAVEPYVENLDRSVRRTRDF
jgi:hypothetical protein